MNLPATIQTGPEHAGARPVVLIAIKSVYGRQLAYPANETATLACALTGTITLRKAHLATLYEMGFSIVVEDGRTSLIASLE